MYASKAVLIANRTIEGISIIDIHVYDSAGKLYHRPTKQFIDSINERPYLDREEAKVLVSQKYGIPLQNIKISY